MNLAQAQQAIQNAQTKAKALGINVDIAIVDLGAHLLAFARMDGAWVGSIDIAIKKARTSALFCKNTQDFSPLVQPGMPLYNIEHSNGGMITFPGGVVIRNAQGQPVGAIGISGSTIDNDHAVALAGSEI